MNLVRLSFIVGMTGLAGYSLTLATSRPYVPPVETACSIYYQVTRCMERGGYYNEWLYIVAIVSILVALAVACVDLARRVY